MIEREAFDWGVRLTAHPFRGTANHSMIISSEIRNYRTGRGSEVCITFPAASLQKPLRLSTRRPGTQPWERSSETRGPSRPKCGWPRGKKKGYARLLAQVGRQDRLGGPLPASWCDWPRVVPYLVETLFHLRAEKEILSRRLARKEVP